VSDDASREHLWKPGESGNPNGRPKVPEEIKKLRKLNRNAFELMLDELMWMSADQIRELSQAKDVPVVKLAMAAIIAKSAQFGDHKRFGYLLEQMIGKAMVRLEASGPEGTPLFAAGRTREERAARMKEITEALNKIKEAESNARSPIDTDTGKA
jgi:hypothetical protein